MKRRVFDTLEHIRLNSVTDEWLQMKFADTEVILSLDAALDLQFWLANLLHRMEEKRDQAANEAEIIRH